MDEGRSDRIEQVAIEEEVRTSFLEYAMSVIVSRALPDVRDGLKPVHRRILYAMNEAGMRPGTQYKKCARVVGDVMGKYHPHGDDPIYDALVRLGQDFASRYPLVDGQGNFGSVDDPPAAMRYTECRLQSLALELLEGIDEETVDFQDNYDGNEREPVVLPARFPNLLVNGGTGIAVGMATNIPPHNLGEVIDAVVHVIDHPDATPEELIRFVKGPDFPSGGYLMGTAGIRDAYLTGRGSMKMRAVADVEEIRKGRTAIVVREIPFQVSKDRIMEKIAQQVREKVITGIADLRDESDRDGTRLVIELKQGAVPQVVLNQLHKGTQLQETFAANMLALVDGVPRTLNLVDMIGHYLDHQMEVVERRARFRLERARRRAHIVEGLLVALDHIDEVVRIIRRSTDVEEARRGLMGRFELSETQASHILDMPLRRLTTLEISKLREEHQDLLQTIADLQDILADPARRRRIIAQELVAIRDRFGGPRRTRIVPDEGELSLEDLIADDELVITISANGYLKSVLASAYRRQVRGGRGVKTAELREDDAVTHVLHTSAHAYLLFFTNTGKVYRVKAHELPRKDRTARGVLAQSVLPLGPQERIEAVVDTRDYETARYLVMVTRQGQVKKTRFSEYDSRASSLIAINLQEGDEVVAVRATNGENDLLMFTRQGLGIRFGEEDIRPMGRSTRGVRGMRLRAGDEVISAASDVDGDQVLLLTTRGYGKRTDMSQFPKQRRGGVGVRAIRLAGRRGDLVGARAVSRGAEIFVVSSGGVVIRTSADQISRQKREASGVKVMNLPAGALVSAFALVPVEEKSLG
ncbi:MAG: DNA gyrase subunit A [Actinomycetota bacterium]|nr:DNA gyrase subunit A [Actinomycetota bacterium]